MIERRWTPEPAIDVQPVDTDLVSRVEAAFSQEAAAREAPIALPTFDSIEAAEAALRDREAEVEGAQAAVDAAQHELAQAKAHVAEITAAITTADDDEMLTALATERSVAIAKVEARETRIPAKRLLLQQAQDRKLAASLGLNAVIVREETSRAMEHDASVRSMLAGVCRDLDSKLIEQAASSARLRAALEPLSAANVDRAHQAHAPAKLDTVDSVAAAFWAELASHEQARQRGQSEELQERLRRGQQQVAAVARERELAAANAPSETVMTRSFTSPPLMENEGVLNDL